MKTNFILQAPIGPYLLSVSLQSVSDNPEPICEADFDAWMELLQLLKKQHIIRKSVTPH